VEFIFSRELQANQPRHAILRQLLEAVDDDRAEFGRFLALFVTQASADAECLSRVDVNNDDPAKCDEEESLFLTPSCT
jgi:hypothetical protein